ncbi:hypothetical protein A9Q99_17175 [Gammaproteobacteria bacterium 45_16_T64]|nr:hypothetical protein A9Q99_17175 [Gammaproteobacteria bacterium 45_16_T64]
MADIDSVLEQVRAHYLSAYIEVIDDHKKRHKPASPEILLEVGGREDKPFPYRLYRTDLMSGAVESPNMTDFNNDTHLTFEPIEFVANKELSVTLSSISWDAIEFDSECFNPESELLANWALKWIDTEDDKKQDENGLGGYIHSITFPEITESHCSFSVDFGSAGIGSFFELINVFISLGIRELSIHSNS